MNRRTNLFLLGVMALLLVVWWRTSRRGVSTRSASSDNRDPPRIDFPIPPLSESLRAIEAWHEEHYPPGLAALRPGLTRAQVDAIVGAEAHPSPELYELYAWHDGMRAAADHEVDVMLLPGFRFVPLAEAVRESQEVAKLTGFDPGYWDAAWVPYLHAIARQDYQLHAPGGVVYSFGSSGTAVFAAHRDLATAMAEHAERFARDAYYVDDEGSFTADNPLCDEVWVRYGHPAREAPKAAWSDGGVEDGLHVLRRSNDTVEERFLDDAGHEVRRVERSTSGPFREETTTRFDAEGRRVERHVDQRRRGVGTDRVRDVTWTYAPDHVTVRRRFPKSEETIEAAPRADGTLRVLSATWRSLE